MPKARFCEHHHDWAVALNFNILAPPPPVEAPCNSPGVSLKIEDLFKDRVQKYEILWG